MPDRKTPPQNRLITHVPFIAPEKESLDNGFPVYLLPGGTEEIMRIEWVFHAGSYYQHKPLVTYSTVNLLNTGTRYKTAEEINEILDFYGAYLSLEAQKDICSVVLFVLNKNLGPVLELVREIIRYPVFPEEEIKIFLNNQKQSFVVNSRMVQHIARSYFTEALFGEGHPYGYRLKEEDFGNITRDDLVDFHSQRIHGGNGLCIVSGKIPPDLHQKLNKHFGDDNWVKQNPVIQRPGSPINTHSGEPLIIHRPEALQSAIRIGKLLISRKHNDYHRVMITNALLGGFFGSRLMRNIRQEKGYTYGVNSSFVSLVRQGYFFIGTQVGVDVCSKAVDEIYLELKRLRTDPASDYELEVLRNYLSGNFLRSFDGPFAQGEKFKELIIFDLSPDHFDNFLQELKYITPEIIMETAAKYFNEESMTEVIAGKK